MDPSDQPSRGDMANDSQPNSITLDRANEYEAALGTKYRIDVLLMHPCKCGNYCYAKLSRLDLATFRCALVNCVKGDLTGTLVRRAITQEVRKRMRLLDDGTIELETRVGDVDTCLVYFYSALGCGHYQMETIFHAAGESAAHCPEFRRYYGKDDHLRAIARVCNKIREIGECNPIDGSIMLPPNETRKHFLRSGSGKSKTVLTRKTLKVFFGCPVRVHKASSFMNCACCIAIKNYAENRCALQRSIVSLLGKLERGDAPRMRGNYVKEAAKKIAEDRLQAARFVDLRKGVAERLRTIERGLNGAQPKKRGNEDAAVQEMEEDEVVEPDDEDDEDSRLGEADDPDPMTNSSMRLGRRRGEDGVKEPDGPVTKADKEMEELCRQYLGDEIQVGAFLRGMKENVKFLAGLTEKMKDFHYTVVRLERVLVLAAQEAAASFPDDVCTIIIDGCGKERTKLPYFPTRMKGVADDSSLMKCPLYGIQEAAPVSAVNAGEAEQHVGASDFELRTHDFVVALEWTNQSGADLYGSILIHYLYEKPVVPRVLVIVLDNAAVNKGEPIMAWLAFIMMRTEIEEIHLYYPTKGHTHTTLDAHFGRVKPKDTSKNIRTPQELKRHLDSLPLTRATLNFSLYEIQEQLCPLTVSYSNRMSQHNFVLHKNDKGEVLFKYSPLLRFAEHMTERVRATILGHSYFMSMTDEERNNGIPVFRMDDGATVAHFDEIAARTSASPCTISEEAILRLTAQIPAIHWKKSVGEALVDELVALKDIAVAEHGLNLGEILDAIKGKAAPRTLHSANGNEGQEGVEDLMRRVVTSGRQNLKGELKSGTKDLANVRETEIWRMLGILKGGNANIEKEFAMLASKHCKGKMAPGYKKIVDKINKSAVGTKPRAGAAHSSSPRQAAAAHSRSATPVATPSLNSPKQVTPARLTARAIPPLTMVTRSGRSGSLTPMSPLATPSTSAAHSQADLQDEMMDDESTDAPSTSTGPRRRK